MTSSLENPYYRVIINPAPAVGVDWSITPPGGELWRVLSIAATLTTSAAVANRRVTLLADDGAAVYWGTSAGADQAAGLATRYVAAGGLATAAALLAATPLPLPAEGLHLWPGYRLRAATALFDAADAWSAVVVYAQVYPQGSAERWLPDAGSRRGGRLST